MEGEGTQNRPLASIDRVDFGFGCDSVGCWNLQKVAENYKAMSKTAYFSPKSTNFAYNASRVLVSWVLEKQTRHSTHWRRFLESNTHRRPIGASVQVGIELMSSSLVDF